MGSEVRVTSLLAVTRQRTPVPVTWGRAGRPPPLDPPAGAGLPARTAAPAQVPC